MWILFGWISHANYYLTSGPYFNFFFSPSLVKAIFIWLTGPNCFVEGEAFERELIWYEMKIGGAIVVWGGLYRVSFHLRQSNQIAIAFIGRLRWIDWGREVRGYGNIPFMTSLWLRRLNRLFRSSIGEGGGEEWESWETLDLFLSFVVWSRTEWYPRWTLLSVGLHLNCSWGRIDWSHRPILIQTCNYDEDAAALSEWSSLKTFFCHTITKIWKKRRGGIILSIEMFRLTGEKERE